MQSTMAAFYRGWDMTLVIVATLPFLMGVGIAISVVNGYLKVGRSICIIKSPSSINIHNLR